MEQQAGSASLELRGKGTTLLGHQTPRCGEHSRLNGCPYSLDHYISRSSSDSAPFPIRSSASGGSLT